MFFDKNRKAVNWINKESNLEHPYLVQPEELPMI